MENIVSADEMSKYIISTDDPVLEIAGLELEENLQVWDILCKVPDHDHIFIAWFSQHEFWETVDVRILDELDVDYNWRLKREVAYILTIVE